MRTLIVSLAFPALFMLNCKKDTRAHINRPMTETEGIAPVTSIDGIKNGTPFINYLGAKQEGC